MAIPPTRGTAGRAAMGLEHFPLKAAHRVDAYVRAIEVAPDHRGLGIAKPGIDPGGRVSFRESGEVGPVRYG